MKKMYLYFVVDSLTETVIGDFTALNNDVAKKILDESYKKNEKLQAVNNSLKLLYVPSTIDYPETFDEVIELCIGANWVPFVIEEKNE